MTVGMALAFAGFFRSFDAFLPVVALSALGWAAGRWGVSGGSVRDVFERSPR
ncbi:MAG: hypothetical protein HOV92_38970 [Streptomyces sp.]|nr:hypothetical protein [Streptomyces sp.]